MGGGDHAAGGRRGQGPRALNDGERRASRRRLPSAKEAQPLTATKEMIMVCSPNWKPRPSWAAANGQRGPHLLQHGGWQLAVEVCGKGNVESATRTDGENRL